MPNVPPKKAPIARPPSNQRLKEMFSPGMVGAMPPSAMGGEPASSLRDYAMRDYEYNPQMYTPEERRALQSMLNENKNRTFPDRDDVLGEYYAGGMFGQGDSYRDTPAYARQDSLYEARKVQDASDLDRRAMLDNLMSKLGNIFGPKNVRVER